MDHKLLTQQEFVIRRSEFGDFERIKTEPIDEWAMNGLDLYEPDHWVGNAFTAVVDGRPVGISGFSLDECGTGRGWFLGSKWLRQRPMVLHRIMKRVLVHLRAEPAVKKIEVTIEKGQPAAVSWAERLGFAKSDEGENWALYVMDATNG